MHHKRLRVGIIGGNGIGRHHARAWQRARLAPDLNGLELASISSRSLSAGAFAAEQIVTHWSDVVNDPNIDVVDVCLPDSLHGSVVRAAIAAGKHVMCEKPLGATLEESRELARLAAKSEITALVPLVYRHVPAVARTKALVAEGAIGDILGIHARYLQSWALDPASDTAWRLDPSTGSGVLGDLGTHLLDLCGHIVPEAKLTESISAPAGQDLTRDMAWMATFSIGITGTFHVSRVAPGYVNNLELELIGSEGSLHFAIERPDELTIVTGKAGRREVERITDMTLNDWLHAWRPRGAYVGWAEPFTSQATDMAALALGLILPSECTSATFEDAYGVESTLERVRHTQAV